MYCELMAEHQLKADTGVDTGLAARWHVVRQDLHGALCGRVLAADAETRIVGDVDTVAPEVVCPVCWARYQEQS